MGLIREYYAFDHIEFNEAQIRAGLETFLDDPALGRAYLFELAGNAVGYCLYTTGFDLEFGGRLALLTDLYFAPAWRGQGFGRAALQFLFELLPGLGFHSLELEVERGNAAARHLYRRFGFSEQDRIPMSLKLSR